MFGDGGLVRVAETSKDTEHAIVETDIGDGELDGLRGAYVNEMGGGGQGFRPIGRWHRGLKKECACNIVKGADGTFGLAVLRGGVRA